MRTIVGCLEPGPYLSIGGCSTRAWSCSGCTFGSTLRPNCLTYSDSLHFRICEAFRNLGKCVNVVDPVTSRPFLILANLSPGRFVAKSKTSLVFSGGTCFLMIWPLGTSHTSRGIKAPFPTWKDPLTPVTVWTDQPTSAQMTSGNFKGRLYVFRKYWATVICPPSRRENVRSLAPAPLNLLTTLDLDLSTSPVSGFLVKTRIPVMKR